MTLFFLVAVLLLVAALLFVLPPLAGRNRESGGVDHRQATLAVYKDRLQELNADLANGTLAQEQYQESRNELERMFMEDIAADQIAVSEPPKARPTLATARLTLAAVSLLITVAAFALYWQLGTPAALKMAEPQASAAGHSLSQEQMLALMARLAARLKANPNDAAGWGMLGRSYIAVGRLNDAVTAFERAYALTPEDVQLLVDYADVMGALQNKNLSGRPAELIQKALEVNPTHPKALALAGSAAFNEKNYDLAVHFWERLLALFPPGSPQARGIASSIAEAKGQGEVRVTNSLAKIDGTVSIRPELAGKVAPNDTLFIYAKAMQGPPMPLAVLRLPATGFPVRFSLDDSMAMAAGMKLSNYSQVLVGARVSRAGSAMPQTGDLEGSIGPVALGASVTLTIERVVP